MRVLCHVHSVRTKYSFVYVVYEILQVRSFNLIEYNMPNKRHDFFLSCLVFFFLLIIIFFLMTMLLLPFWL